MKSGNELTWQERLLHESTQLYDRIEKLTNALKSEGFKEKVGETQFNLMERQLKAMLEYYSIVDERIDNLFLK